MTDRRTTDLIRAQIEYYRARASEYDEWFLRTGRYDRGPDHRALWFSEADLVERALRAELRGKNILELACGTGLWTRHLAAEGRRVVALDASAEVIAINRARVTPAQVAYVIGDIFAPPLTASFDFVFFSFWLSHVPASRFDEFWRTVRRLLRPGGRAFFIDSLFEQESTARDHPAPGTSGVVQRRLKDGREFEIVKVFYEPPDLERRLHDLGWTGAVRRAGRFFLYGSVS